MGCCPHCGEPLPATSDAFCPVCRQSLDRERQLGRGAVADAAPGAPVEFTFELSRRFERRQSGRYFQYISGLVVRLVYTAAILSATALFVGYTQWYVVLIAVVSLPLAALCATAGWRDLSRINCRTVREVAVRADGARVSFRRGWCTTEFRWEALRRVLRYPDALLLLFELAEGEPGLMVWPVPTAAMPKEFAALVEWKAREHESTVVEPVLRWRGG